MTYLPLYINGVFLMMMLMIRVMEPLPPASAEYMSIAEPWVYCHNALILYSDSNPAVSGTVSTAAIASYLPPDGADPGLFTYTITAPGTADTYLTNPSGLVDPEAVIAVVQDLAGDSITAGAVIAGQILPKAPNPSVSAAASVPNGTYALQTTLRNH